MIKVNLLTSRGDDPCPPLPKEWPTLVDYALSALMGNIAGYLLMISLRKYL